MRNVPTICLALLVMFSGCIEFQRIVDPYYDIEAMYEVPSVVEFIIRYGCNVTNYDGNVTIRLPFPAGAAQSGDGRIIQIAGGNFVEWVIEEEGTKEVYVRMNGRNTLELHEHTNLTIAQAQAEYPEYLKNQYFLNESSNESIWLIMPSHPDIKGIVEPALQLAQIEGKDDVYNVARRLFKFLKKSTRYNISEQAMPKSAIETYNQKAGDCDDLSFLYISFLRAAGIPARFVSGYLVKENGIEPHAWVEFYAGEWIPVEVAGTGSIEQELHQHFGILSPEHVQLFLDDGSNDSLSMYSNIKYWIPNGGKVPDIVPIREGSLTIKEDVKLVIYKDGKRELKPIGWKPDIW